MENKKGEIVIYKSGHGPEIRVKLEKNSIWLTQAQIALLFGTQRPAITKHLANIFKTGELKENSVSSILEHTAADGKKYRTKFYNLDMIISVGYRVNSKKATQFRIWATNTLKNYIVKGFVIDRQRLADNYDEFEKAVNLIKGVINKKQLSEDEKSGLLKVITDYANAWIMLQKYDQGRLAAPVKTKKPVFSLDYDHAVKAISEIKRDLLKKKEASDLFGREHERGLDSILKNLNQTFGGRELYPSIEAKAAHLLYFVIKDHPFVDGNKRIGSFLFIVFLARNNYLYDKTGEKKFNDNALVALALLLAESKPREKEMMIKLVVNLVFG